MLLWFFCSFILELANSKKLCPLCWYKFARTFLIWNCSPCWLKLQEIFHKVITDPFTDLFLTMCIILSIYFLALEHYPMSEGISQLLSLGNLVRLSLHISFVYNVSFSLYFLASIHCRMYNYQKRYFSHAPSPYLSLNVLTAGHKNSTIQIYDFQPSM